MQKNHLFLKIYFNVFGRKEGMLEVLSKNIVLVGIIGISGIEYSSWNTINIIFAGLLSGLLARIFHFLYCALKTKQEVLIIDISSTDKLVVSVENEVLRRLNLHRNMRGVLGYLLMCLYYGGNIYYTIKYILSFVEPLNYYWFISFLIGICFIFFIIEPVKIFLQIEAVNYMKNGGGSKTIETFSKFMISQELLSTFN